MKKKQVLDNHCLRTHTLAYGCIQNISEQAHARDLCQHKCVHTNVRSVAITSLPSLVTTAQIISTHAQSPVLTPAPLSSIAPHATSSLYKYTTYLDNSESITAIVQTCPLVGCHAITIRTTHVNTKHCISNTHTCSQTNNEQRTHRLHLA